MYTRNTQCTTFREYENCINKKQFDGKEDRQSAHLNENQHQFRWCDGAEGADNKLNKNLKLQSSQVAAEL